MMYELGTEVERISCPAGCIEPDCQHIPMGSIGVVDGARYEMSSWIGSDGNSHKSWLWRIRWTAPNGETFGWWTHAHAFAEAAHGFPDELWLT